METAKTAKALSGPKLYQERARAALPILVRQAHAGAKIFYSDLATELGMPNPRNLNYVLGSVGTALERLSAEWHEDIPVIQCLVVNQATGLPGEGVGWFVRDKGEFKGLPLRKRQAIVDFVLGQVFAYTRWGEVLAALGLEPISNSFAEEIEKAAQFQAGGETDAHKKLKDYIAQNPQVIGLPARATGITEYCLPSGDNIDVLFSHACLRSAIEVKSHHSPREDIVRGLFQCIKYRAVLKACVAVENSDDGVDAILVLERALPNDLRVLRNILDVKVIENVEVPSACELSQ